MTDLGNKAVLADNLQYYMDLHNMSRNELCARLKYKYSTVSEWLSARKYPRIDKIEEMANLFGIQKSDLIERRNKHAEANSSRLPSPIVTNKVVTFPVIGEIAAGFDKIGMEDWTGDTIEIPEAVLHGHDRSDFFVLRVSGDSMYPHYQEGDYVLVLKQDTLNYSGEVGAILYDDELVSLKKIEYVEGEDWLRLVPINPNHPPKRIEGEALAHCRIIGIPRLLIRKL